MNQKRMIIILISILTAILSTLLFSACNNGAASDTKPSKDAFIIDTVVKDTLPDTENDTEQLVTDPISNETESLETEAPVLEPEFINALTGLESDKNIKNKRPVAIMINNIKPAIPQEGISYADVMYECIVEGGITRLMMVVSDYESLPVVGSVRSSREYYLDFAANHNAIYVHAGGSDQAFREIKQRKVNNLEELYMYLPGVFFRDDWRRKNMGYEHSLMTTGEGIAKGIGLKKYSTTLKDDFDSPLDFVPYGTTRELSGDCAKFLNVTYSYGISPYYEYNETENVYYRFQYGEAHIDNGNKQQLSFTNIIVLYLPTVDTKDLKGHMDVITTGSGEGYYFYGGKYEPISYTKTHEDSPVKLYDKDGNELLINRGKTFFQICTKEMKASTVIE